MMMYEFFLLFVFQSCILFYYSYHALITNVHKKHKHINLNYYKFKIYQNSEKNIDSDEEKMKLVTSIDSCGFLKNIVEYGNNRMARRAVGVLQKMPAYRIRPQEEHYTQTIWACEKSSSYNLAISVYDEMKMNGIPRSLSTYEALMSVTEKTGHYNNNINYFNYMIDDGYIGTTEIYNIYLMSLQKNGEYEKLFEVLNNMKDKNINRDVTTYTACILACENHNNGLQALLMLDKMIEDDINYNTVTCNGALWACVKSGYYLHALQLYEKMMLAYNIKPDVNTYNALIWACEQAGDATKAVTFLKLMKFDGFQRQTMSFDGVLSTLNKVNDWKEMIEIWSWMRIDQVDKSPISYRLLIDALDRHDEKKLIGDIYLEALRNGYYSPWIPKSRVMDLRGFIYSIAKIALKTVLLSMIDGKLSIFQLKIIVATIDHNNNNETISSSLDISLLKEFLTNLCIINEFPGARHTSRIQKVLDDKIQHNLIVDEVCEDDYIAYIIPRDSLLAWIGDAENNNE